MMPNELLTAPPLVPLLQVHDLSYAWPEGDGGLQGLNFHIHAGEKVVLLGANGCGKSTLLKLLNALLEPSHGEIRWQGQRLDKARLRHHQQGRAFRRACVLLFQHPEAMLFNPTVREELAYSPRQLGLPEDEISARVAYWSEQLNLSHYLDKPPFLLSGGQKQKVALASLLTLEPELLLLDEPSASLDPATVAWLIDMLFHAEKTLIIATHNLSLAAELGERAIVLSPQGRLLFDGALHTALNDLPLLEAAGLAHRHLHRHHAHTGQTEHTAQLHSHLHLHRWD